MLASIPSPSFNTFEIGSLEIHIYGLTMALAVGTAYVVTVQRYAAAGGDRGTAERAGFWAVVLGFVGARLAYVSTHLDTYSDDWLGVFRLWEGGIALFGGLTFGTLTALFVLRRMSGDFPLFADSISVALPAAQAIGRWGNYFNQELFGRPTDLPWALEIDPENRPERYQDSATFHPTFLYEMLWNVGIIVFLLWLERKRKLRRGTLFALYWILYGFIRFLLELIRTDTTFRFLGISRNGWYSVLVVLVAGWFLWWLYRRRPDDGATALGEDEREGAEPEPDDDVVKSAESTESAGTTEAGEASVGEAEGSTGGDAESTGQAN
jgi:prolipoprotein diacylglyceryl transferase